MVEIENVILRNKFGTSFSRKLRKLGKIPGIIYGKGKLNLAIILIHDTIFNLCESLDILNLRYIIYLAEKQYKVKIKSVFRHPYKSRILHVDFMYI